MDTGEKVSPGLGAKDSAWAAKNRCTSLRALTCQGEGATVGVAPTLGNVFAGKSTGVAQACLFTIDGICHPTLRTAITTRLAHVGRPELKGNARLDVLVAC